MKTYNYTIVLIFIILNFSLTSAQEKDEVKIYTKTLTSDSIYSKVSEAKSGNWKDVITDFMQASLKDLAGENKSFQFKATLFSLKSQVDSTLLIDYNYANQKFSRNFQIAIGLNLDNDYKFKGFKYGFDWAVINKRDSTVANVSKELTEMFKTNNSNLINSVQKYAVDLQRSGRKQQEIDLLVTHLNDLMAKGQYIPRDDLPKDFLPFLPSEYDSRSKEFEKKIKNELDKIKRQPLLTIGFHSNFQKNSKFLDEFDANMVYLQGLKTKNGSKMEIDFRNQFKAKDSITTSVIKRKEFSSQLGLNISILKKINRSLIEFKPNVEFKRIVSGLMEDEKNNQFLANADVRVRILKNLWLPLILKYDIENNNFFGFLNVSFNFDAIKNQ